MNIYVVFAVLLGIGLTFMVLALRRPRTAEDVLGQPAATRPAAPGAYSDVRTLIELNVLARSTGILTASSGGQTCSMAFLAGRLFHASCGSVEGEDAVRMALDWKAPDLSFDGKAQLPARETIARPIASILDAA
jgi:hypothetical protein